VYPLSIFSRIFVFHMWHPSLKRGTGNSLYARRKIVQTAAENGLKQAYGPDGPA